MSLFIGAYLPGVIEQMRFHFPVSFFILMDIPFEHWNVSFVIEGYSQNPQTAFSILFILDAV